MKNLDNDTLLHIFDLMKSALSNKASSDHTHDDMDERIDNLELSPGHHDEATIALLIETDTLPAVYNSDKKILTDSKGRVVLRY